MKASVPGQEPTENGRISMRIQVGLREEVRFEYSSFLGEPSKTM
jgi:hypothetical protein